MFKPLLFSALISVGAAAEQPLLTNYATPTKALAAKDYPVFADDKDLDGIETAIQRQLERFQSMSLGGKIKMGGVNYPLSKVKASLEKFLTLSADFKTCRKANKGAVCFQNLNASIRKFYNVFVPDLVKGDPRWGEAEDTFFTAYATQPIHGSPAPGGKFTHAIYQMPHSPQDQSATRDQIDFHGALHGKGLELTYSDSLYDVYLLHIEGGGHVTETDSKGGKKDFYLSFDGTNRQHWEFVSKYMLAKGYISNSSIGAQRKFLRLHPDKAEEIFANCPSYVFFKVSTKPPEGAEQVSLTPGRSLATDRKLYAFKGMLTYVASLRPKEASSYDLEEEDQSKIPFQPFSRFFLDQDTGGAITGKGRADLYMGDDDYAQYAATYEQEQGNIFFLLLK